MSPPALSLQDRLRSEPRGLRDPCFRRLLPTLLTLAAALVAGCDGEDGEREVSGRARIAVSDLPRFADISAAAGIDFRHTTCGTGKKYFPETNASGVGFLDYDRDGYLDLYFNQGAPIGPEPWPTVPTNRLYRNRGDLTFEDVTEKAGVGDTGVGMGVACADYDNDGWPDIYVCNYGKNRLYRNNGGGTFSDVTDKAGVAEERWSSTALFADLDGDGDLDLFIGNYVDFAPERNVPCGLRREGKWIPMYCNPDVYDGLPETLYRNNGDGTFTDVSEASGIRNVDYKAHGKGLGVAPCDYDDDGDIDVFVANDFTPNFLFRNEGTLRFVEVGVESGVAFNGMGERTSAMGPDWSDVDHDGDFDLIVSNIQRQANTYWENLGNGYFEDMTYPMGLGEPSFMLVGFSLDFFDYDLDGDEDLFVSNGHMIDNIAEASPDESFEQPPHLYENLSPQKGFRLVSDRMGGFFAERYPGRACAIGDIDNDGDGDIAMNTMGGPGLLVLNNGGERHNWLGLQLVGTVSPRDAIGARVTVTSGDWRQMNEVRGTVGLGGFSDLRLVFGLGSRQAVDEVEIRWPSGKVQELRGLELRRYHEIREPPADDVSYRAR
ncbi:MAG: CRTAC1 family protein [Planctomycetota bacterium]